MIQTKRTPGQRRREIRDGVVGVAGADLRLEAGDDDARIASDRRAAASRREASGGRPRVSFSGIAGADQPPDPIEADPLQGKLGRMDVPAVRRIERAAEEADPHAWIVRGKAGNWH